MRETSTGRRTSMTANSGTGLQPPRVIWDQSQPGPMMAMMTAIHFEIKKIAPDYNMGRGMGRGPGAGMGPGKVPPPASK